MNYSTEVKQKLLSIITKMDSYYWLFTKHPKTDFSRKKKWSFEEVMKFMLTMEGKALRDELLETSVYKGYKQDKIEMRGDRAEMSDFPLYLNTVAGGLDRRDQTIGGFSFVVKIYAVPVVEIIG